MSNIRSFKELRVWQNAMDAAMRVYELSKRFPAEERYSMTDQIRRSSRSVPSNVAEAWRKRRYEAAFVSKLNDAEGEAAETQTWIELALRCRFLSKTEAEDLDHRYEQILGQLVVMVERPGDWVVGANRRAPTSSPRVSASPRPRVSNEAHTPPKSKGAKQPKG